MGIESGRSPGLPDRNVETSETGGCSDGKALSYSSCRLEGNSLSTPLHRRLGMSSIETSMTSPAMSERNETSPGTAESERVDELKRVARGYLDKHHHEASTIGNCQSLTTR